MENLFGNYPFAPDQKKPFHITKLAIKPYIAPADNPYHSDVNYLYVSTDKMTVGIFQLAPGSSYDPPDIHDGDEAYYGLNGILTIQNPVTGEFAQVGKGEGLLVPKRGYHKGYNFEQEVMRVLFVIAPNVQTSKQPQDFSGGRVNQYKGKFNDTFPSLGSAQQWNLHGTTSEIGRWPVSGPASREEPILFYKIPENKKLINMYGTEHPMLVKFIVSNDILHLGEMILPSGGPDCRASEPNSHNGDCMLFVESGPATVFILSTGETYQIQPEEAMFIPENIAYQIFNFTGHSIKLIFAVSPNL